MELGSQTTGERWFEVFGHVISQILSFFSPHRHCQQTLLLLILEKALHHDTLNRRQEQEVDTRVGSYVINTLESNDICTGSAT